MINSIVEIKYTNGATVTDNENVTEAGKKFFSNMFKEPLGCPFAKILKVISLFLSQISPEMNLSLHKEITENDFFQTLSSFQRCKRPGPDGLTVEFYLGFYELLKGYLLKVVNESKNMGRMGSPLNSTHISLILKSSTPSSFKYF
jgi:hypothetical protein